MKVPALIRHRALRVLAPYLAPYLALSKNHRGSAGVKRGNYQTAA